MICLRSTTTALRLYKTNEWTYDGVQLASDQMEWDGLVYLLETGKTHGEQCIDWPEALPK